MAAAPAMTIRPPPPRRAAGGGGGGPPPPPPAAGDHAGAAQLFGSALREWSGRALADLAGLQ
ncbi:hypothetical protein, partial [Nocardia abscessus]|uniref:hypothetical protein n=1 Tax=Nocardia abscessus TaxID=120957 RepID=UPI0024583976